VVDHVQNIRECFVADFETGQVTWAERPRHHFTSDGFWLRSLRDKAGAKVPVFRESAGHLSVGVAIRGRNFKYLVHRIVWALAYGEYPDLDIDHIDNNPANNALSNLRLATRSQNCRNAVKRTVGLKGAHMIGRNWLSATWVDGKHEWNGPFKTEREAHEDWVLRNVRIAGEFFNAGYPSVYD